MLPDGLKRNMENLNAQLKPSQTAAAAQSATYAFSSQLAAAGVVEPAGRFHVRTARAVQSDRLSELLRVGAIALSTNAQTGTVSSGKDDLRSESFNLMPTRCVA
jgi:hypothetical protein